MKIESGYRPGVIGRAVELHARYYAATSGFGSAFEARIAGGLAEFVPRLGHGDNGLWTAVAGDGQILGTIAIDGEDLGANCAHLRWFIVDPSSHGLGLGTRLLDTALAFCDARPFAAVHLWTFQGLDTARKLYESRAFLLAGEKRGAQWGVEVSEQEFVRLRPR